MAESQAVLELYNMALGHVGNGPVTAQADSPVCQLYYPYVRDTLLSWSPWTFATMRRPLVRLEDAPASDFTYQFAYPTLPFPLRVLAVDTRRLRYSVETYSHLSTPDTVSRVVLTNADSVVMRYIARVSESIWPPLVLDTAALWLAVRITQRLAGRKSLREQLFAELGPQLQRAMDIDGHQDSPPHAKLNDTYVVTRGGADLELLELEDVQEPF